MYYVPARQAFALVEMVKDNSCYFAQGVTES